MMKKVLTIIATNEMNLPIELLVLLVHLVFCEGTNMERCLPMVRYSRACSMMKKVEANIATEMIQKEMATMS